MNNINTGANKFCWPGVISAIAGISTDEAAGLIQAYRGNKRRVAGVFAEEGLGVLEKLGFRSIAIQGYEGYTIFMVLCNLSAEGEYIFTVQGHVICIEIKGKSRYLCDNHTKSMLNAGMSARLGQKVLTIHKISKMGNL